MKKLFNKKTLSVMFLITTLTLVMAATGFAGGDKVSDFIRDLTNTIRGVAVVFIALAAVLVAVMFMLGAANPKWKNKSKDALYALIIGVIVLVLANDIAGWVGNIVQPEDPINDKIIEAEHQVN